MSKSAEPEPNQTQHDAGQDEPPREPLTRVECPAVKGYDNPALRWMIVGVMGMGMGFYCLYDAFIVQKYEFTRFSMNDINRWFGWAFNFYGTFIFLALGVFLASWAWLRLKRVLVADEEGIGYAGREKIAWADITELNGKRVEKGLLVLTYGDDEELVLDSWKLKNFRDLVAIIEQHVPEDKQVK